MKQVEEAEWYQNARDVLFQAKRETDQLIEDIQAMIDEHGECERKLKEETVRLRAERGFSRNLAENPDDGVGLMAVSQSDSEMDEDDLPSTVAGDEYRIKRRNLQARMREALVLKHKGAFFLFALSFIYSWCLINSCILFGRHSSCP